MIISMTAVSPTQLMVESTDGFHMSDKEKVLGMEDYPGT